MSEKSQEAVATKKSKWIYVVAFWVVVIGGLVLMMKGKSIIPFIYTSL